MPQKTNNRLGSGIASSHYLNGMSHLLKCLEALLLEQNLPNTAVEAFAVSLVALAHDFIDIYARANGEQLDNVFQILLDNDQYIRGVPRTFHNDIRMWELLKQLFGSQPLLDTYKKACSHTRMYNR